LTRIDHRPHVQNEMKGVARFGSRRIHAIQLENVVRRDAYCGAPVENARGSLSPISCPSCIAALRRLGRAG
jgi:hypothetical protein